MGRTVAYINSMCACVRVCQMRIRASPQHACVPVCMPIPSLRALVCLSEWVRVCVWVGLGVWVGWWVSVRVNGCFALSKLFGAKARAHLGQPCRQNPR